MKEKCCLCNEEIKKTFLDKIKGTTIRIKEKEANKIVYICPSCQKKHKEKLKKAIEEK